MHISVYLPSYICIYIYIFIYIYIYIYYAHIMSMNICYIDIYIYIFLNVTNKKRQMIHTCTNTSKIHTMHITFILNFPLLCLCVYLNQQANHIYNILQGIVVCFCVHVWARKREKEKETARERVCACS